MDGTKLAYQRDLYGLLLALSSTTGLDLRQSLEKALEYIVGLSDAEHGYIEVRRESGEKVYTAHALSQEEISNVQSGISMGIVAETLNSGEIIMTPSAMFDPRFNSRKSVQAARIQSVFCAPLLGKATRGVLYLQGEFQSGDEGMQIDAEYFTRHVSPLLDQLLVDNEKHEHHDPFYSLREKYQVTEVVGNSEALYKVLRSAMMVAPLEVSVMLTGDSGTGKTQLANVIHSNSGRESFPFVEVNCATLSETMIEKELFGSINDEQKEESPVLEGRVGAANGGTLFLDEVSSMPVSVQGKLLQFLHSGEYYPVGASTRRQSRTRIICATGMDMHEAIEKGLFREDLFYRINTFPIDLPPLEERDTDVCEIADSLCRLICAKHQFPRITISEAGRQRLLESSWPGNIRELNNCIESACIRAAFEENYVLGPEQLTSDGAEIKSADVDYMDQSFQDATQKFQALFLTETLEKNQGNVSQTARQLKISRTHLHHLINSLGIDKG